MGNGLKIAFKLGFKGLQKLLGKAPKATCKAPQVVSKETKTLSEHLAGNEPKKPSELDIIFGLFQKKYGDKLPANFKKGLSELSEKDLKALYRSLPMEKIA